jgi:hypothetical protein
MKVEKIFIGGWFQRTTLHLSEIYDFLKEAESPLDLDPKKLKELHDKVGIEKVELKVDDLEYIELHVNKGLVVKIFEDGLITLANDSKKDGMEEDIQELTDFYEKNLSPAISYIFSLGAPIPKELANIKTIYPYFVVLNQSTKEDIHSLLGQFNQHKHFEILQSNVEIYRGDKLYIINNLSETLEDIERFIQEQIFIREFKGQLHRYLNLHRIIWEKIADVKEKGQMKGKSIGPFYGKVQSYAKTINLIGARIGQMGSYIGTRDSIAKDDKRLQKFVDILEFKYETLSDTLSYVQDIWSMTENYVNSALELFSSVQARSTESSVNNLTIITSMGVGATLIGLFSESAPDFTWFGVAYFFILAFIGWSANKIMKTIAQNRKYTVKDVEVDKNIQ